MALGFRVDIEKGVGFVVLVDFIAGNFAVDDFGENARGGGFRGGF